MVATCGANGRELLVRWLDPRTRRRTTAPAARLADPRRLPAQDVPAGQAHAPLRRARTMTAMRIALVALAATVIAFAAHGLRDRTTCDDAAEAITTALFKKREPAGGAGPPAAAARGRLRRPRRPGDRVLDHDHLRAGASPRLRSPSGRRRSTRSHSRRGSRSGRRWSATDPTSRRGRPPSGALAQPARARSAGDRRRSGPPRLLRRIAGSSTRRQLTHATERPIAATAAAAHSR